MSAFKGSTAVDLTAFLCGPPSTLFLPLASTQPPLSASPPLRLSSLPLGVQVDLIEQMGPLPFNLEFFTECQDMRQLLAYLDAPPDVGADDAASDENQGRETEGQRRSSGSVAGAAASGPSRAGGKRERFKKLTEELCDVVDSYSLVSFYPLNIQV